MKYKTPIYSQQKMAETVMILLRPALLVSAKPVIYTAHSPTYTSQSLGGIHITKCDSCISVIENINTSLKL
jgi:hypothetical protein